MKVKMLLGLVLWFALSVPAFIGYIHGSLSFERTVIILLFMIGVVISVKIFE